MKLVPIFEAQKKLFNSIEERCPIQDEVVLITNTKNMKNAIVFLSCKGSNQYNGFVQLYPSFCSVSGIPILILYDLYVDKDQRGLSIGRSLMNQAKIFARDNGYKRLELSTAKDNLIGQALYESLGYEQDSEFYHYSLEIEDD